MNWEEENKKFWQRQKKMEIAIFLLGLTIGLTIGIIATMIVIYH